MKNYEPSLRHVICPMCDGPLRITLDDREVGKAIETAVCNFCGFHSVYYQHQFDEPAADPFAECERREVKVAGAGASTKAA